MRRVWCNSFLKERKYGPPLNIRRLAWNSQQQQLRFQVSGLRFYSCRTPRGHRHHRHPRLFAGADAGQVAAARSRIAMRVQPAPDRRRDPDVRDGSPGPVPVGVQGGRRELDVLVERVSRGRAHDERDPAQRAQHGHHVPRAGGQARHDHLRLQRPSDHPRQSLVVARLRVSGRRRALLGGQASQRSRPDDGRTSARRGNRREPDLHRGASVRHRERLACQSFGGGNRDRPRLRQP